MTTLHILFLKALYSFGVLFGLITFTYNHSNKQFKESKALQIYNKSIIVSLFASIWILISQSFNDNNQSILKTLTSVFVLCSRYITVIYFCVISSKENNLIKEIASRAQILFDSIGTCGRNETKSSVCVFVLSLLLEIISFLMVLQMNLTFTKVFSILQFSLTIFIQIICFATSHLTLMYILTLKFATNMLSNLNCDIRKALRQILEIDKDGSLTKTASYKIYMKKMKTDLEIYEIHYVDLINFVGIVHSLWSIQITLSLITWLESLINSVRFYFNICKTSNEFIYFSDLFHSYDNNSELPKY